MERKVGRALIKLFMFVLMANSLTAVIMEGNFFKLINNSASILISWYN